jgi:hypothetical protein
MFSANVGIGSASSSPSGLELSGTRPGPLSAIWAIFWKLFNASSCETEVVVSASAHWGDVRQSLNATYPGMWLGPLALTYGRLGHTSRSTFTHSFPKPSTIWCQVLKQLWQLPMPTCQYAFEEIRSAHCHLPWKERNRFGQLLLTTESLGLVILVACALWRWPYTLKSKRRRPYDVEYFRRFSKWSLNRDLCMTFPDRLKADAAITGVSQFILPFLSS